MSTETLMTDAPIQEGTGTQIATPEGNAPAAPAGEAQQQQALAEQNPNTASAEEGTKTEGEQEKPAGAPEKYEFAEPDGSNFDTKVLDQFSEIAKELNLPQEAAQKMLDKMGPMMASRQAEVVKAARTQWTTESQADKEFGGDKLGENLSTAKKALDAFGTPELRSLLEVSGLGNHPEMIRLMYRAGKAISEDRMVTSGAGERTGEPTAAQILYPKNK